MEMTFPVPTTSFLETSPDATMMFAPFRYTHPPLPILPFLLKQNLSQMNIARNEIRSWVSHDGYIHYGL